MELKRVELTGMSHRPEGNGLAVDSTAVVEYSNDRTVQISVKMSLPDISYTRTVGYVSAVGLHSEVKRILAKSLQDAADHIRGE